MDQPFKLITETADWTDYQNLIEALEALGRLGHVASMTAVGMYHFKTQYKRKEHTEESVRLGIQWLETAAKNGSAKAAYELAEYYADSWSNHYKIIRAADYYEIAAKDPGEIGKMAQSKVEYARRMADSERSERLKASAAYRPGSSGGTTRTKSEIDNQIAATALAYSFQSDALSYNDSLADEQNAKVQGMMAGLEFNEQRALFEERKNAADD